MQPLTRDLADFLDQPYPEISYLVSTWLVARGLAMVAGYRGVGKTYLAVSAAYAVACGTAVLGFKVQQTGKVIYIDGEMDPAEMKERFGDIIVATIEDFEIDRAPAGSFRILTHADHADGLPDLALEQNTCWYDNAIDDADLVFLDNLSSLARTGDENSADSWIKLQEWLLSLRRTGQAVCFVHHTGKPLVGRYGEEGSVRQRGTSKREDVLTSSILLSPPKGQDKWAKLEFGKLRRGEKPDPLSFRPLADEEDGITRLVVADDDRDTLTEKETRRAILETEPDPEA